MPFPPAFARLIANILCVSPVGKIAKEAWAGIELCRASPLAVNIRLASRETGGRLVRMPSRDPSPYVHGQDGASVFGPPFGEEEAAAAAVHGVRGRWGYFPPPFLHEEPLIHRSLISLGPYAPEILHAEQVPLLRVPKAQASRSLWPCPFDAGEGRGGGMAAKDDVQIWARTTGREKRRGNVE